MTLDLIMDIRKEQEGYGLDGIEYDLSNEG
jgi:hypothetical protein